MCLLSCPAIYVCDYYEPIKFNHIFSILLLSKNNKELK